MEEANGFVMELELKVGQEEMREFAENPGEPEMPGKKVGKAGK